MILQGGTFKGLTVADTGPKVGDNYFNNTALLLNNFNASGNNSAFFSSAPLGVGSYTGYFTGSSCYLDLGNQAAVNIGTSDFTVECWIYILGGSGNRHMFTTNSNSGLGFNVNSSGQLNISLSGVVSIISGATTLPLNTWIHVAGTRTGTTFRLFLNGVQDATVTASYNFSSNSSVRVGYESGSQYFNGYISNLRLVIGSCLYSSNFTPSTSPLLPIAGTALLTCQDSFAVDRSQNNFAITNTAVTFIDPKTIFTVTRTGTPTQGSFSPYGNLWSNYFDGSSSSFSVTNNSALSLSTGDFTVEAWIYLRGTSKYSVVSSATTSARGYAFEVSTTVLGFNINNGGSNTGTISYSGTISANAWHHIVACRSGTTTRLFLDGAQVASATLADQDASTTNPIYIASQNYTGFPQYFVGYLSNVRVVKGTALYTSNFIPSTTPLTAVSGTSLLTCQSNRFIDNSSNAFAITLNGTPTVERFNPFQPLSNYSPTSTGGSVWIPNNTSYLSASKGGTFPNFPSGAFTFEAWVYPVGSGSTSFCMGSNANYRTVFYMGGSGVLGMDIYFQAMWTTFTNSATWKAGQWNHIAWVRDASNVIYTYINGNKSSSSVSSSVAIGSNSYLDINTSENHSISAGSCYISDLRLTSGTALYTNNFTPPTAPLASVAGTTALFNFTNANIFDNVMQNDILNIGNVQANTSTVKYGSGSIYFNGSNQVQTSNNVSLTLGTADWTLEFWLYWDNITSTDVDFLRFLGSAQNGTDWGIGIYNFASNLAIADFSGAARYYFGSKNQLTAKQWNHVAFTRSGSTFRVFINGVLDSGSPLTGTDSMFTSTYGARIGTGLIGNLADLRLTRGVARYTANFTPPQTELPTFGAPTPDTVQYLVVAGGGAGVYDAVGAGGAGGFRTGSLSVSANTSYTITVGAGGPGNSTGVGANGSDSVFSTITSNGGGKGAGASGQAGATGGSGGGGGGYFGNDYGGTSPYTTGYAGNTPSTSPSQGNNGGNYFYVSGYVTRGGGGGGGAGGVGGNASGTGTNIKAGDGGIGAVSAITGFPTYYAGGGGGGSQSDSYTSTKGLGGLGGGGDGSQCNQFSGPVAGNGTTNTGGGGGGGARNLGPGGSGGSGVVIVAYPLTYAQAANTTGSPTYSRAAGNHIYKFTGSGTITF